MVVGGVLVTTKRLMKKFAFGTEDQPESIEKLFKLIYELLIALEESKEKLVKLEKEIEKKIDQKKTKKHVMEIN